MDRVEDLLPPNVWSHFLGKAVGIALNAAVKQKPPTIADTDVPRILVEDGIEGGVQVAIFFDDYRPENLEDTFEQALLRVGLSAGDAFSSGSANNDDVEMWVVVFKLLAYNDLDQSAFERGFNEEVAGIDIDFFD